MNKCEKKLIKLLNDTIEAAEQKLVTRLSQKKIGHLTDTEIQNLMNIDMVAKAGMPMVLRLIWDKQADFEYFTINSIKELRNYLAGKEKVNSLYASFDVFSTILNYFNFSSREKIDLVLFLFKRNLESLYFELLDESLTVCDFDKLLKYHFTTTDRFTVQRLITSGQFDELDAIYHFHPEQLSQHEKAIIEEINNAINNNAIDFNIHAQRHCALKEHYFEKYPTITEEDVQIILSILKEYDIADNIINDFEVYLTDSVKRYQEQIAQELEIKPAKPKFQYYVPPISDKRFKAFNKELRNYYDLDTKHVQHALSLKEQIHCVSLLQQMGINQDEIICILNRINKLMPTHPIAIYMQFYERFAYYKNNEAIKNIMDELDSYISHIITTEEEEYELICLLFKDGIDKLLSLIPKTYDYEFDKAQELNSQDNQGKIYQLNIV